MWWPNPFKVRGENGWNPRAAGEAEGRPRLLRGDDVGVHQLGPARIQACSPVQEHHIIITHSVAFRPNENIEVGSSKNLRIPSEKSYRDWWAVLKELPTFKSVEEFPLRFVLCFIWWKITGCRLRMCPSDTYKVYKRGSSVRSVFHPSKVKSRGKISKETLLE